VGCYIWYSEEGTGRGRNRPSPLLAVPNVTAHPLTASVLPPTNEEVNAFARVRLSVCLSVSKITQKRVHGLDEMLRVDRCRDVDELINF